MSSASNLVLLPVKDSEPDLDLGRGGPGVSMEVIRYTVLVDRLTGCS